MIKIYGKQYQTLRFDCRARSEIRTIEHNDYMLREIEEIHSCIVDLISKETIEENVYESTHGWNRDRLMAGEFNVEHKHYMQELQWYLDPLASLRL